MALRNIYVEGDPILRKKCRPVDKFDDKLATTGCASGGDMQAAVCHPH